MGLARTLLLVVALRMLCMVDPMLVACLAYAVIADAACHALDALNALRDSTRAQRGQGEP